MSQRAQLDDPHAPSITSLIEDNDWASLVCYYIAHGYTNALDMAIECVQQRAKHYEKPWRALHEFLSEVSRDPMCFERQLTEDLTRGLSDVENASLVLLVLYPRLQLYGYTNLDSVEAQKRHLQTGLEAGQQALEVAEALKDEALYAFLTSMVAQAHFVLKKLEAAHDKYDQAVRAYRHLARQRPEIYQPCAGVVLHNFGCVQRALHHYEEARKSFFEALEIRRELVALSPAAYHSDLAITLHNLGAVESDLNHFKGAREYYMEALSIRQQLVRQRPEIDEHSLGSLSNTLNNLGLVQHEFGDLEGAHQSHLEALEIRRELTEDYPDVYSSDVGATLFNLGNLQQDLNDLDGARESYSEALETYRQLAQHRPDVHQAMIANILNNLGVAQCALNDLDSSRQSLLEALEIQRRSTDGHSDVCRADLAMTLVNLGAIERDFGHLETAHDDLQQALDILRQLDKRRPEIHRHLLCDALNNLGVVQHDLGNLEDALRSHQEALEIRQGLAEQWPEVYKRHLSVTFNNLGTVQRDLSDLDGAYRSHHQALKIRQELADQLPDTHIYQLAITLNNLGIVQHEQYDLESARQSYFESLQIHQQLAQSQPALYQPYVATILNNLGMVQQSLNDLESARETYRAALEIRKDLAERRPEIYRPYVAVTLKNLGTVLHDLNDLQAARRSHLKALKIYRQLAKKRPSIYRPYLATCLNNLGTVKRDLNDLQSARRSHLKALKIYQQLAKQRPDIYRPFVATSLNNLGLVQNDLHELETALQSFRESADLYSRVAAADSTSHLVERLRCWANLGRLYLQRCVSLDLPDYREGRRAFRQARDCIELLRGRLTISKERRRVLHECLVVYERLAATCVDIWRIDGDVDSLWEAVEVAEASRTRALTELLTEETLEPANTPPHLVKNLRNLRRGLRHAENRLWDAESLAALKFQQSGAMTQHVDSIKVAGQQFQGRRSLEIDAGLCQRVESAKHLATFRRQVKHLRQSYQQLLDEIQQKYDSHFNPDVPVSPIAREVIQRLVPSDVPTAIVEYCLTRERSFALIVTQQNLQVVELRDLNDAKAFELSQAWFEAYYASRNAPAAEYPLTTQWEQSLPKLLEPVSQRAIQPVVEALAGEGIRRLVLTPNRALHVFPLHACLLHDGRYLADAFEVTYIPSLSILDRCAARHREDRGRLLLVENPTYDLVFTEVEGTGLRHLYSDHVTLYGRDASKERLLRDSISCNVLHYCGHTKFYPRDPLRSSFVLHSKHDPDHWLTLHDIFCDLHLPDNQLTVINGCESGMLLPDQLDEHIGLPSGFLFAGAACVLSTLWAINDISSTLLIDRFHREWRAGKTVGTALHEAQRWLRKDIVSGEYLSTDVLPGFVESLKDENLRDYCEKAGQHYARSCPDHPPFSSPVYWAPFVAMGLTYPVSVRDSHHN